MRALASIVALTSRFQCGTSSPWPADPWMPQVMAIAYSEEPCPGQAEEEEISWLPIIIGIIAG